MATVHGLEFKFLHMAPHPLPRQRQLQLLNTRLFQLEQCLHLRLNWWPGSLRASLMRARLCWRPFKGWWTH